MPEILQIGSEVDVSGFESLNSAYQQSVGSQTEMVESLGELTAAMSSLEEKIGEVIAVKQRDVAANEKEALSLKEVQDAAVQTGEAMKGAMSGIGGLGAAIGIGVFAELISHIKDEVIELGHLSEATGISIGKLTGLKDAMGMAGVETARLPMQMTQLASAMEAAADGSQKQVDAFARLGVNTDDWAQKMPNELDLLKQIGEHMQHSSDQTADLAAARALFGRNVVGLTAFLRENGMAMMDNNESIEAHKKAMEDAEGAAKALQVAESNLKMNMETALMPAFENSVIFIGMFIAGVYKVVAAMDILMQIVKVDADVIGNAFSKSGDAIGAAFKGHFTEAGNIITQLSNETTLATMGTIGSISSTWDDANKKGDELLAKMELMTHKSSALTGDTGPPVERKGDKGASQEALNIQRQIGEAKVKLQEDQAKQELEVHKAFDELELAQSGLAQSKSLADKATVADAQHTLTKQFAEDDFNIQKTGIDEKYSIDVASLNKMLALHTSNGAEDKKLREKLSGDLILLATTHKDELVRIKTAEDLALLSADAKYAAESAKLTEEKRTQELKASEQELKRQEKEIDGQLKSLQERDARELAELANKAKLHELTSSQEFAQSQAINDQEYMQAAELIKRKEQLFIKAAQDQAVIEGRTISESEARQLEGYQKIDNELLAQYDAYLKRKQKLDDEAAQKQHQVAQQTAQQFVAAMDQALVHAANFHDAVAGLWQSMGKAVEQSIMKMLTTWITSMLEGKALNAEASLSQIGHSAASAAANAWSATAAIPIIGPVLAPVAAAAAFTGVMAFGAGIGSAEQGAVLPQDMMILAHRNEMILPPSLSSGMQSMISGGTAPGGPQSAPTNITVNHHITAMDGADVHRVLSKHNDVLAQNIKTAAKGGRLSASDFAR